MRLLLFVLLALAGLALPGWIAPSLPPVQRAMPAPTPATDVKTIALSFDDLPRGPGGFYTPEERTRVMIDGLRRAGVTQVAFFVNPGRIGPNNDGAARADAYVAAGHVIADHSFSHRDLSTMSAEAFLADVDKAEAWLRPRAGYRPWFRFPGLNQGGRDRAKRQAVLQGLAQRGLLVAAVTADGSDWNIDGKVRDAKLAGRPIDEAALQRLYVETMVQAADFSDGVMRRAIGRSPAHMLLLHETDLAARYLVPLVEALRRDGWRIITADQAYADPVYHAPLDVITANGTLTEAIAFEKQVKGPWAYERTDPRVADKLLEDRVFRAAGAAPSAAVVAAR